MARRLEAVDRWDYIPGDDFPVLRACDLCGELDEAARLTPSVRYPDALACFRCDDTPYPRSAGEGVDPDDGDLGGLR